MEARFGQYGKAANGIAIINTVAENRIKMKDTLSFVNRKLNTC